jgi:hypothetical protein
MRVTGVIFVASFGFDYIWPDRSDVVGAEIYPDVSIRRLSDWNIDREDESFLETCREIRRKCTADIPVELKPRWLVVLVNKVDLYWDAIDRAKAHYVPGCESPFDKVAGRLVKDIGELIPFTYVVLPITVSPGQYVFDSNYGGFDIEPQLEQHHADASLNLVETTLEGLCG